MAFKSLVAVLACVSWATASAQTACPVGTAPGSATCGPSPTQEIASPLPGPRGNGLKHGAVLLRRLAAVVERAQEESLSKRLKMLLCKIAYLLGKKIAESNSLIKINALH